MPARVVRVLAYVAVAVACAVVIRRMTLDRQLWSLSPDRIHGGMLIAAAAVCAASQLLYFDRWYWIIRVMQAPLSRLEALSAASLAQLLGLLAFGGAAGDVYRGVVAGTGRAGHRVGIATTILVDRLTGLYGLILLAAVAATLTPGDGAWLAVRQASLPVLWLAVAGGAACITVGLSLDPSRYLGWMRSLPGVGRLTEPLLAAAARYRARPLPFLLAIVGGMVVHALNAVTLWCVAGGLGVSHPSLAEHCLIMPLATCTGLLPLPLAGLGAMELVVDELYQAAMPGVEGAGAVASIGLRVVSIATNVLISAVLASLGRSGYTLPSVTHQDETSGPGGADS
jgi:hypothetical protein